MVELHYHHNSHQTVPNLDEFSAPISIVIVSSFLYTEDVALLNERILISDHHIQNFNIQIKTQFPLHYIITYIRKEIRSFSMYRVVISYHEISYYTKQVGHNPSNAIAESS